MRLVFAGTPATAIAPLEALARIHQIQAVITRPAAARGRSSHLVESEVACWARDHGVEVLAPTRPTDRTLYDRLGQLAPDCCAVVAYGGIIPARLLAMPQYGWINLHFSILPEYRGAAPVQRALLDGRLTTGVTTFRLVPALDAGPVYLRQETAVGPEETAGDLLARLSKMGAGTMVETLDMVTRGMAPTEQEQGGSLAPKVEAGEARLDLSGEARAVVNRVRAMSPEPGAWARLAQQRFKVLRAGLVSSDDEVPGTPDSPVGSLVATKRHLYCRVGDGWIELIEVQPEGKKPMAGADWARGRVKDGVCLA